jgi:hypothetical protein
MLFSQFDPTFGCIRLSFVKHVVGDNDVCCIEAEN